ncbi:MAG: helix-turn-helix domain-containing protein [Trueperaceae bacterium]|nr:helix-turn-helix domain-containing protein [Trueperaceae bacterium]
MNTNVNKGQYKLALNLKESAEAMGVSVPTMSKMLKEQVIPCTRYGRRIFVSVEALEAFLNEVQE